MISIFLVIGYCGTLFTTSSFISDLIFKVQNYLAKNSWLYEDKIQLSKISLALIYSLLDMINSPNSNTSCTDQSNLFLEFLIRKKRVWMSRSFGAIFFPLTIYFFSLYANRLQILHKHCFQFLLALTIAPLAIAPFIGEIENHVVAEKNVSKSSCVSSRQQTLKLITMQYQFQFPHEKLLF